MPVPFSKQTMSNLLVGAWEGGSNYWVDSVKYLPPKGMTMQELKHLAWDAAPDDEKRLWRDRDGRWPLYLFLPFLPPSVDWKIEFASSEGKAYLTPKNMREAAEKLLEQDPHIFARIKSEDDDAGDADAWLQTAIFGEVIFG
jgi:hypothetical protein